MLHPHPVPHVRLPMLGGVLFGGVPSGIRTRVSGVKGRKPSRSLAGNPGRGTGGRNRVAAPLVPQSAAGCPGMVRCQVAAASGFAPSFGNGFRDRGSRQRFATASAWR